MSLPEIVTRDEWLAARTALLEQEKALTRRRDALSAMDILFLLVPLSVLLVFALMAVFAWALQASQFDDLQREGARILEDAAILDGDQGPG